MSQYSQLDKILQLPIIDYRALVTYFNSSHKSTFSTPFAVLLEIADSNNPIKRIIFLLLAWAKIKLIQYKLSRGQFTLSAKYAVYPDVHKPVAIFELGNQAENYSNNYVMPPFANNLNGRIRKIMMKFIKFHPSTGAIIMVINENR